MHTWHYDEVDQALLDGRIDAAGAWPGAWRRIAESPLCEQLEPHGYPAGSVRHVSYSGCHAWAIPTTCGDRRGAQQLLVELLGQEAQAKDATGGTISSNVQAMAAVVPTSDTDSRRLEITRGTIANSMITYPSLPYFPEIESAGWKGINEAIRGMVSPQQAARNIQRKAEQVVANLGL